MPVPPTFWGAGLTRLSRFLSDIGRVLRPGGTLVFHTPNMLVNVPKEILYTKSLSGWRHYHCSLQTVLSLPRLLRRSGFVPVVIEKHWSATPFPRSLLLRVSCATK
jgi:hypothetical protein